MISINEFTTFLLTQDGFKTDRQGELRYYGHLFFALEREIIEKKIKEYKLKLKGL